MHPKRWAKYRPTAVHSKQPLNSDYFLTCLYFSNPKPKAQKESHQSGRVGGGMRPLAGTGGRLVIIITGYMVGDRRQSVALTIG